MGGAVLASAVIAVSVSTDDPPPPVGETYNIYVEVGAGSCPGGASSTPIEYEDSASPDRRCGSFDQAWDAMSPGQEAQIRNGTYTFQHVTGNKAGVAKLIGESKSGVVISGADADCRPVFGTATVLCADGDNLWIENVTADAGSNDGPAPGSAILREGVRYENVDILGDFPDIQVGSGFDGAGCTACSAAGFTWNGGTWGDANPPKRPCVSAPGGNGEPVWVYDPNVTINGITFSKHWGELETIEGGPCAVDDNPHLETFRLEEGADNLTVSNSRWKPGSNAGSGYFFTSADADGVRIFGNYFADNSGASWLQFGAAACLELVSYNTFSGPIGGNDGMVLNGGCAPDVVGNLGPIPQGDCSSRSENVWGGSGSCGTDLFVGSTPLGYDLDTGNIAIGSPAIDAAETPGASDYCTDPANVNSIDFDGDVRPFGSACDAGADEWTGG